MDLEKVIKERYSVRSFSDKKIDKRKLKKILEAGRQAPTAANFQPQRIYVIESPEGLEKIRNVCKMTYNAPVVLLVCADLKRSWKIKMDNEFDSGDMDVSIVGTHMMLEAWNLGIGSCWIRAFNSKEVAKEFKLHDNIKPSFLLCLGYKESDAVPNEKMHFKRRELEDTVTYC